MWRLRWVCRGARSRSGGAVGASTEKLGWRIATRGLTGRRGEPQPGSRSGSAVFVAAPGAGRCICRRVLGCRRRRWRVLRRNGLNRLSWIDRPTGQVIRRYERSSPGELVHLDIKKVEKIPPGSALDSAAAESFFSTLQHELI